MWMCWNGTQARRVLLLNPDKIKQDEKEINKIIMLRGSTFIIIVNLKNDKICGKFYTRKTTLQL